MSAARLALVVLFALPAGACRGEPSSLPPIRVIRDMDGQPKGKAESQSQFFGDGTNMRPVPKGAIAQEDESLDDAVAEGRGPKGYVEHVPIPVDAALLDRGQDRFEAFCVPCHDRAGTGRGTVVRRGFPAPIDLSSDRTRGLRDGEIFRIVSFGVRNMPSHRHLISVHDRWALTAWVRVIQTSRAAKIADLGGDVPPAIEEETP